MSFNKVLKRNGFKRLKKHHAGIIPYQKGEMYVEVYKEHHIGVSESCWAIGGGLKSIPNYPGGYHYFSPDDFEKELAEL